MLVIIFITVVITINFIIIAVIVVIVVVVIIIIVIIVSIASVMSITAIVIFVDDILGVAIVFLRVCRDLRRCHHRCPRVSVPRARTTQALLPLQ